MLLKPVVLVLAIVNLELKISPFKPYCKVVKLFNIITSP